MTLQPDWNALLTNLAHWASTLGEAMRKVAPPIPITGIVEADRDAYMAAKGELEEAIFNYLASQCYLVDEVPELYEEAANRIRRLGFTTARF